MSTQDVLTTPELLSAIFQYLTKKSTATNMQVCKFWAAVGKPLVWRCLDSVGDLQVLLRLLARWDFDSPFALPSSLDWPHFLECSRLVRHLLLQGNFHFYHRSSCKTFAYVLDFVFATHSATDVFPNLRILYCKLDQDIVHLPMSLLHPGVTTWYVQYITDWPKFEVPIPVQRLFGLVSLEIGTDVTRNDLTGLSALYKLPHLATLVLYPYAVTYSVLEVLSRFPALEVIRTRVAHHIPHCGTHRPPPSLIKDGSFRMLTVLTISGCPHQISEMLDDENFPFHIERLIVESNECAEDPSPSPVYPKIVERIPTLTKFELREMIPHVSSPFASLKPFLSYNLIELRVQSYLALAYSAVEIEELVRSLPIIEVLYLHTGTLSSNPASGTFTLNHLPLFARHCPKLAYLRIRLDTSYPCDTILHDIVPFSVLEELDLGASFYSPSLSRGATALLAFLLPQDCQLTFRYPYHSPFNSMLFKLVKDLIIKKPVRVFPPLFRDDAVIQIP